MACERVAQSGSCTMVFMEVMLTSTVHLPEIEIVPGDAIVRQGDSAGAIWVPVSGCWRRREFAPQAPTFD